MKVGLTCFTLLHCEVRIQKNHILVHTGDTTTRGDGSATHDALGVRMFALVSTASDRSTAMRYAGQRRCLRQWLMLQ